MNEMNELEMQLHSWVPRRPSEKLERALFEQQSQTVEALPAFRLRWLVPATVTFLLMCVLVNQRTGPVLTVTGRPGTMATVALSNQSVVAWSAGSFSRDQNGLPAETFEWTNVGGLTSSNGSLRGPRGAN
jgi:hypothetical protein